MELNEYQKLAARTAVFKAEHVLIYPVLGLTNEAGEVAGKMKKLLRDKNGVADKEFIEDMKGELGDVLWYVAICARDLNMTLEQVAQYNIKKLESRAIRGTLQGSGDKR